MVDLHHHLLFGIDDGSPDLETSVAMVEMAVEDGITHIVATPHANALYEYDRDRNEGLLQKIRESLLPATAAKITLGLGSDFHVNFENTEAAHRDPFQFSINGGNYLLIELPDTTIPPRMGELLYQMRVDGLTPILTHPERNIAIQRSRDQLREWMKAELLVQVTAGSITGNFGRTAHKLTWEFLENGWVHVVSTDAHNLAHRPPKLSPAYAEVEKRLGKQTAERLFVTNPLAIFENRPLPEQPQPSGVFEEEKTSWMQRLMERFR